MGEMPKKVQRALGALDENGWTDLQHRRIAKRLDEALDEPRRTNKPWALGLALAACVLLVVAAVQMKKKAEPATATAVDAPVKQEALPVAAPGSELGDEAKETK